MEEDKVVASFPGRKARNGDIFQTCFLHFIHTNLILIAIIILNIHLDKVEAHSVKWFDMYYTSLISFSFFNYTWGQIHLWNEVIISYAFFSLKFIWYWLVCIFTNLKA